mmetsp:Transcript_11307/g.17491  ORF Transcript_11307/g.17491 Transcript_11307/m.17491 type:complete len:100 (-) Transcript_11307:580-879(-)
MITSFWSKLVSFGQRYLVLNTSRPFSKFIAPFCKTSWLWCLSSVFSQQTACSTTFSTSPSLFGKYVQCRESQLLPHKLAGTMATAHHQFIAYNSTVAFN